MKEGKKLHVIIDSPSASVFSVVDNVPSHSYDAPLCPLLVVLRIGHTYC